MSNIRSYLKAKEKRDGVESVPYESKIKKHRLTHFYRIALAVLVLVCVVVAVYIYQRDKVYTSMQTLSTVSRTEVSSSHDLKLGSSVLTYSKDGAHCTDVKGEAMWNQTYEMQNPIVTVCDSVAAIGDYNGRTIYVVNETQQLGEINTNMPIRAIGVASNGIVTAILEDTNVTWIHMYGTDSTLIASFSTRMENSGYPSAVGISGNAKLVAVAYAYAEAGTLNSRIAFHNFGDVGQNYSDKLVGGYVYRDSYIPYIYFMRDDVVFAAADNRIMFYGGGEKPSMVKEVLLSEEIQAIYSGHEYMALAFRNDEITNPFKLVVYNSVGEEVLNIPLSFEAVGNLKVILQDEKVILYNETECQIYTMQGVLKYSGTFEKTVNILIPQDASNRYMLVTPNSLDIVELR